LSPLTSLLGAIGLGAMILVAILVRMRAVLFSLGILWFFVMHLLVSSVIPLELVYEHRNYMGSIGIFLAVFALLFTGKAEDSLKTIRYALAFAVITLYAGLTFMRANEWAEPVRLAHFESSRHPDSPRANYDLGLLLSKIAPAPGSLGFTMAIDTFSYSAQLEGTSLLPLQALLFLHAKHDLPIPDKWWEDAKQYIETKPLSAQDRNAVYALINGQIQGVTHFDNQKLGELVETVYRHHSHRTEVIAMYANFLLNVAGKPSEAERYLLEAVVKAPRNAQMWANLVQYQLATGQLNAAREGLSRLREFNRFGRLDKIINDLEATKRAASGLWGATP